MNIGLMCHDSWGGSSAVALRLAGQLGLRGINVHLFTLCPPHMSADGMETVNRHCLYSEWMEDRDPAELYTDWKSAQVRQFSDMVMDIVLQNDLNVLHFHYANPFAAIISRIKKAGTMPDLKIVGTFHGTDVTNVATQQLKNMRMWLSYVDFYTTVSHHHAVLAGSVFGLAQPPQVLPNFVDLSAYGPGSRLRDMRWERRPRIVHISNFRPIKNPQLIVQLFLQLREHLDCEIWMVGDGPLREEVMARFKKLGLADDVRYLGLSHNVADILSQVDLLLVTSHMESFCLAALEAMAAGVPVLAPRVGGLPELIRDGSTGMLFESNSPHQAVALALSMLEDRTTWARMATNAVLRAHRYDQERQICAYHDMYASVLSGRDQMYQIIR